MENGDHTGLYRYDTDNSFLVILLPLIISIIPNNFTECTPEEEISSLLIHPNIQPPQCYQDLRLKICIDKSPMACC